MSIVKPPYTSSIVQVSPKFTVPPTLLHKLVHENQSAIGVCVRTQKGIDIERHKLHGISPEETLKLMTQIDNKTQSFSRMYSFHAFPEEYDEVEQQPFILLRDSKKNPLIAVGIEGDFPKYTDDSADGFSEPFMLLEKWLGDKVAEVYKMCGNSPQKVFDYLQTSQFAKDFEDQIGHRGGLYFMPSVGTMFCQEKNDAGIAPEWGHCSFAYGYTEPVIVAATPVEEPKPEPAKRSKWADDDTPAQEPKPVVEPPKQPEKPAQAPVDKVAAEVPVVKTMKVPPGMHGKDLKNWYRKVSGDLPKNWRERPDVEIQVQVAAQPAKAETAVSAAMTAAEKQKKDKDIVANTLPIVSGEQMKAATEYVKRWLGDGAAVIKDPAAAAEMEAKLPTFTDLMKGAGIAKLSDFQKLTASFKFAFVKEHPELAAILLIQFSNTLRDLEEHGDKKLGELTGDTPATPPVVEPSTPSPEPVKEKKASGGSSRWA